MRHLFKVSYDVMDVFIEMIDVKQQLICYEAREKSGTLIGVPVKQCKYSFTRTKNVVFNGLEIPMKMFDYVLDVLT